MATSAPHFFFAMFLMGLCVLSGCPDGADRVLDPEVSGESHWLEACDSDAACGEGACVCGVCTGTCAENADCVGFGQGAVCGGEAVCGLQACLPGCQSDGECGQGLGCLDGVCALPEFDEEICGGALDARRGERYGWISEVPAGVGFEAFSECLGGELSGIFCADEGAHADVALVGHRIEGAWCFPGLDGAAQWGSVGTIEDNAMVIDQPSGESTVTMSALRSPIISDVMIKTPGFVLHGPGRDATVKIQGDVEIAGTNTRLRHLAVDGAVVFAASGTHSLMSHCRIGGDLTIESNHAALLGCTIEGNVSGGGKHGIFIDLQVAGRFEIEDAVRCDGCVSIEKPTDD